MRQPSKLSRTLDEFIPRYDVIERHAIAVRAEPAVAFRTAGQIELENIWVVRAIIRTREFLLGADPTKRAQSGPFLKYMQSLGWGKLSETPGQEIVMGAVTQPWIANPIFRALAPGGFATYVEPGNIKIAWGIRADAAPGGALLTTETRTLATDVESRKRFSSYWWRVSPGVRLIRRALLREIRRRAQMTGGER